MIGIDNGDDALRSVGTDGNEPRFTKCVGVFADQTEWIGQDYFGILECYAVPGAVRSRLLRIPTRVHGRNMYVYTYYVNGTPSISAGRRSTCSGS